MFLQKKGGIGIAVAASKRAYTSSTFEPHSDKYIFRVIEPKEKGFQEEDKELIEVTEMLRRQLVELACEKGFSHREVIELSQRLDKYIVQLQSRMNVKKSIN